MEIRISRDSDVPLRQQIAAQIEYLIATGKLKSGEPLPSVRALARQLRIHHNTVSLAYQDVTAFHLLSRKHGSRLIVCTPEKPITGRPDLDDLINQTIRLARRHGYTLEELSARTRERLIGALPDHVLALSSEAGMRRLLQFELAKALRCRVKVCSPQELAANPELALGALVVSPPGALLAIKEVLPKDRPAMPIRYCSAESQFELVRKLKRPSIVVIASVSEHFLMVVRGLLGPIVETRHTLVSCLVHDETTRIPAADLLLCDVIVSARSGARKARKNDVRCPLIASECLSQIASAISISN